MVNKGMVLVLGMLAILGMFVLEIGIYFALFSLLFWGSNVLLGTTLSVFQFALFSSLFVFIVKLIFIKKGKN